MRKKHQKAFPPRRPIVAMVPKATAIEIQALAAIERSSVSKVVSETLVQVFGPFVNRTKKA